MEWSQLAHFVQQNCSSLDYDAVVCDETQDFTANHLRTLSSHLAEESSLTIVLDTAQRIYARGYTWREIGFDLQANRSHTLRINYRNSTEIAKVAAAILDGVPRDDDFTIPSLERTVATGIKPVVLEGLYNKQVAFCIKYIKDNVNLDNETVAFLKPKGGNWFQHLEQELSINNLPYVTITREAIWPDGDEEIALCTLHSSKGLEFDHVFIIGFNQECLSSWEDEEDHRYITTRKLLGMGIGRAKKSLIIGYKPTQKSDLIDLINPDDYELIQI